MLRLKVMNRSGKESELKADISMELEMTRDYPPPDITLLPADQSLSFAESEDARRAAIHTSLENLYRTVKDTINSTFSNVVKKYKKVPFEQPNPFEIKAQTLANGTLDTALDFLMAEGESLIKLQDKLKDLIQLRNGYRKELKQSPYTEETLRDFIEQTQALDPRPYQKELNRVLSLSAKLESVNEEIKNTEKELRQALANIHSNEETLTNQVTAIPLVTAKYHYIPDPGKDDKYSIFKEYELSINQNDPCHLNAEEMLAYMNKQSLAGKDPEMSARNIWNCVLAGLGDQARSKITEAAEASGKPLENDFFELKSFAKPEVITEKLDRLSHYMQQANQVEKKATAQIKWGKQEEEEPTPTRTPGR